MRTRTFSAHNPLGINQAYNALYLSTVDDRDGTIIVMASITDPFRMACNPFIQQWRNHECVAPPNTYWIALASLGLEQHAGMVDNSFLVCASSCSGMGNL